MAEKKRRCEAEVMIQTSLRFTPGDVPDPDPAGLRKAGQKRQILDPNMEGAVKRLIAHLKGEK